MVKKCKHCGSFENLSSYLHHKTKILVIQSICISCKSKISSITQKGRLPWNKGIPMSEKSKELLSKKVRGRVLTEEHKKNISKGLLLSPNKYRPIGKPSPMKGKTHIKETRLKISEKMKGRRYSEEYKQNMSTLKLEYYKKHRQWNKGLSYKIRSLHNNESSKKISEGVSRHLSLLDNSIHNWSCQGKNEKLLLDLVEQKLKIKLERQYTVKCKKYPYKVDGYCKKTNTVFEVDEAGHFDSYGNYTKKTLDRKEKIVSFLKCNWVSIKDTNIDEVIENYTATI